MLSVTRSQMHSSGEAHLSSLGLSPGKCMLILMFLSDSEQIDGVCTVAVFLRRSIFGEVQGSKEICFSVAASCLGVCVIGHAWRLTCFFITKRHFPKELPVM